LRRVLRLQVVIRDDR